MTAWDRLGQISTGTSDWINRTSMTSLRSLTLTVVASCILLTFTTVSCLLLLDKSSAQAVLSKDAAISAAARTTESAHHESGKSIANLIFAFLTAALVTGVASQATDRFSSRELQEAKERGRIHGAALAASLAGNGNGTTKEQPAQQPSKQEVNVNVGGE